MYTALCGVLGFCTPDGLSPGWQGEYLNKGITEEKNSAQNMHPPAFHTGTSQF